MNNFEFKKMLLDNLLEDEKFSKEFFDLLFSKNKDFINELVKKNLREIDLNIKKLDERAQIPVYGSEGAAAFDLRCILDVDKIDIQPGDVIPLNTGLAMAIPNGYVGIIAARSGLGCNKGLIPSNAIGVIDSDYRGEIRVALYNHSKEVQTIQNNERIAQMMLIPCSLAKFFVVDNLDSTERGEGGFGHSGRI